MLKRFLLTGMLVAATATAARAQTTIFMVRTGSNTLPVEMFLYLQKWQDPTIAALSSLLILFAILLVLALSLMARGRRLPFIPQRSGEST